MARPKLHVFGYHQKTTHALWEGFCETLDVVSNESHPDNQGRLQMLGNDPEHGQLEWECITDKDKWDALVKQYGAEQGFGEAANDNPDPPPAKPSRKAA